MDLHELEKAFRWTPVLILSVIAIDSLLGDPVYRLHPIRLIGDWIRLLEKGLFTLKLNGLFGGLLLLLLSILGILSIYHGILYLLSPYNCTWIWKLFIGWNVISIKDLYLHAFRISDHATRGDLESARYATSMLTGRDVQQLDAAACQRAGIESVSESYIDGIYSPLFYFFIFGLEVALIFKVISTLDSMVGYKNDRYRTFGTFSARADDLLNYIPARLGAFYMACSALVLPFTSIRKAFRVGLQQHHHIPGPNAGWSEAFCAGAIQRKIVGPIYRQGKLVTDLWIGDPNDPPASNQSDVFRTLILVSCSTFLGVALHTLLWLSFQQKWIDLSPLLNLI